MRLDWWERERVGCHKVDSAWWGKGVVSSHGGVLAERDHLLGFIDSDYKSLL